MQTASYLLIGQNDYASFARVEPQVNSTVREVSSAVWRSDGDWLYFDIVANGFLPQMVRGIVGTLIWVGTHKIDVSGFREIFHRRDRRIAGPTVPAKGLCFIRATY
jgi:tRNA pseudouridine38-40 synthase